LIHTCNDKLEIDFHVSEEYMSLDESSGSNLDVEVAGINFSNPLLLASGIADETGLSMVEAVRNGAGGVVTKSLSLEAREGHGNPCIYELPYGMINAMGLPNPGIDDYSGEIEVFRKGTEGNTPIIASIFGSNLSEYAEAARRLQKLGVDGIEINGSCPNAKGLGLQFGQDPDVIRELVWEVVCSTSIPVFFKLTPNTRNINILALAAQEGGAHGLVAINTLQARKIDIATRRPVLTNVTGGLSGPAIKPVGVRCVHSIASDPEIEIPIIAVGGASGYEDVVEYLLAGASAVQIGTAVSRDNLKIFSQILAGIVDYIGNGSVKDIIGASLEAGK
jgi:dihydroorotate dehydrogenase (NAD+) catalytic subunit